MCRLPASVLMVARLQAGQYFNASLPSVFTSDQNKPDADI
jgi:hypothetical protein